MRVEVDTTGGRFARPLRVLLVSAATPDTFWSYKHALPFISRQAAFPPLGLLTVAAMLPRSWDLRLVDLNVTRLTEEDIAWSDYVFVSAMLVQSPSAREVIRRCTAKGKPIVAGGPLFTTGHADFPEVKHFVLGEAENAMQDLIADMEAGTVKHMYESPAKPDLSRTPPPRWDLIDQNRYAFMPVQFSRGCPFDCEFCDIIVLNGRVPRVKTPEQMLHELDTLVDAGWDGTVFIVDDNFIGNKVKVKDFLRELVPWRKRRRVNCTFITEASLNIVDDPELLDLMRQAGFTKIFVGIETQEEESLLECGKVQNTRRDMLAAVKTLQRAGFEVMGGFIIGFDNDKPSVFEQQIRFIQEAGITTAMVGLLMALPGTRLFARLKEEGRLLYQCTGNNTEAYLNFVPKLDRDMLIQGYRSLLKHLYAPEVYYRRALTFLREYRPKEPRSAIVGYEWLALLRSLWRLGVRERGRLAYWRFCAHTLIHYPRAFPEAISLAIAGYHFRRVAMAI